MSLTVPANLLEQAQRGPISDDDFIECIQSSLPYAWSVMSGLATELREGGGRVAVDATEPPDEASWGQLFRLVGSDAMRGAVERHFGVRMAFQNCCKVGFFDPAATEEHAEFVTPRAQVLNQKPELINC
ncbi:MAG TPA: SCO5389 family protein [Pseudonocardia sp.]|uniref:SCO5389 family protein n=1 Tax=Pseudonocardia sp. TaxID=60912 RepID=UPI002BEF7A07|nr:SCO5389 family protein [Pseudonocardia sp.]HTF49322.1 SCO5389 family protein [Pseudonocardia sp.]